MSSIINLTYFFPNRFDPPHFNKKKEQYFLKVIFFKIINKEKFPLTLINSSLDDFNLILNLRYLRSTFNSELILQKSINQLHKLRSIFLKSKINKQILNLTKKNKWIYLKKWVTTIDIFDLPFDLFFIYFLENQMCLKIWYFIFRIFC